MQFAPLLRTLALMPLTHLRMVKTTNEKIKLEIMAAITLTSDA